MKFYTKSARIVTSALLVLSRRTECSFPWLGKAGMGSVPQGFIINASYRTSRKDLLSMRHTGLDPVSPTSIEGFKIISSFIIRPTMRFRVAARNDKEPVAPHPNPPRVGEGIFEYTFPWLGKVGMGSIP